MREQWVVGEKGLLLDHNHPTQTPSQKKLLAKLHLPPEDLSMVLDLGKSFVPPRNIVEFMRKRGYHNITPKHIHNLFEEHGYSSAYDAHELLTTLQKKRDIEGWYVDLKRDCKGRLSHVFWMSKEQITLARRFPCLLLHDNAYQSNRYDLNVGLFVGVNNFGQSLLLAQAVVIGEKLETSNTNFLIGWPPLVWPLSCSSLMPVSRQVTRLKQFSPLPSTSGAIGILPKMSQKM